MAWQDWAWPAAGWADHGWMDYATQPIVESARAASTANQQVTPASASLVADPQPVISQPQSVPAPVPPASQVVEQPPMPQPNPDARFSDQDLHQWSSWIVAAVRYRGAPARGRHRHEPRADDQPAGSPMSFLTLHEALHHKLENEQILHAICYEPRLRWELCHAPTIPSVPTVAGEWRIACRRSHR
jgi:hypothetical protein